MRSLICAHAVADITSTSAPKEQRHLAPFVERAEAGGMPTVAEIQQGAVGQGGGTVHGLPTHGPPRLAQGGASPQAAQGKRSSTGCL
jgi:hypothetical protein